MRIRRKKWARPELAECPYYTDNTEDMAGKWRQLFSHPERELYLEVGCGKGHFAAAHALRFPDINIIAADIKADMLGVARRNIESIFAEAGHTNDNLYLACFNVADISRFMGAEDRIGRIYINFCNPWNRGKHNKRRLTHPRQLMQYRQILVPGGEIHFKTDDDTLFADSLEYFAECGFEPVLVTYDLHSEGIADSFPTEHERMFSEEGIKIKYARMRMKDMEQP
ncbi:MAG: tRNA (guanosine(46)-N7)-methyltransferase TrmB [Oscillospiraceae bacterium]|nr:tRNA (guanosine(46)-N7)-methyltransferase TrmB [Oscillospiraceae bacterium]MBQ9209764.1 tRNA (guanosine(46)-N7)-methyltransferase TrmB [Oscillospiraceae bacterium]